MTRKYCVRYLLPPDNRRAVYHVRNGQAVGLPIAFAREDMWKALDMLVENANRGTKRESIYMRNKSKSEQP